MFWREDLIVLCILVTADWHLVEIWLFECSQPDYATFGYDRLGISPKIKLLASGERIFDLLWWVVWMG